MMSFESVRVNSPATSSMSQEMSRVAKEMSHYKRSVTMRLVPINPGETTNIQSFNELIFRVDDGYRATR